LSSKYCIKIFLVGGHCPYKTIRELARFDVGIVVVTKEYFERKEPMIELIAFVEAQKKDQARIQILPLFHEPSRKDLEFHLNSRTWEDSWKKMSKGCHPIVVEKCKEVVKWLCNGKSIVYNSQRQEYGGLYIDTIFKDMDKLCKKRSFASSLH